MRILILLACLLAMGASCTKRDVVVDTREPAIVEKVRYVPVPAKLTAPTPIAEGSLDQVIDVARERKQQIQSCNADKAAIAGIAGTPVPC